MSNVFHRSATQIPVAAAAGDGCYVVDANGKRYLDASGGAAVSCLGHSHAQVIAAIKGDLKSEVMYGVKRSCNTMVVRIEKSRSEVRPRTGHRIRSRSAVGRSGLQWCAVGG